MIVKTEKILLIILFILVIVGVVLSRVDLNFYEAVYVREDGFIEWLTVLSLLMGAFFSAYRIIKLKSHKKGLFLLALLVIGVMFIFGAGEEISWGQRLFNIESHVFFKRHNSQMEMNLHNLIFAGKKINKIVFGTFLGICVVFYFLFLPIFYRKIDKVRIIIDSLAMPVPKVLHILSYITLALLVFLTDSGKKGELLEFGGCWIFLLTYLCPYNREIYMSKVPTEHQ